MKRAFSMTFITLGVVCGALSPGAFALMALGLRDDESWWFTAMVAGMALAIACVAAVAVGITLHEPRHRMRRVPHPIAVGRSGAPEMTDPMPSPARVRRPVSQAYSTEKRTLSEGE